MHWSSELEQSLLLGELDAATLMLPAANSPPASLQAQRITTLDIQVVQSKRTPLLAQGIADGLRQRGAEDALRKAHARTPR